MSRSNGSGCLKWGLGIFILLAVIGMFVADENDGQDDADAEDGAAQANALKDAPEAPAFSEIRDRMEDMTDAQWNRYSSSLEGHRVDWTGWVADVNEKALGGFEVWVDMDDPEESLSVQDVECDIPENLALRLNKESRVRVVGIIGSVVNVLGSCQVSLEEADVEPIDDQ